MKNWACWPGLIMTLFIGFVLISGWSFYRAAKGTSAVTDRDYYSHGLRYNQTLLERQAAASLGWQAVAHLEGQSLRIRLRDREQRAVAGATGTLTLLGAAEVPPRQLPLREVAPGSYQAEIPAGLHGEQTAEIAFQREGARLNQRLLLALR